MEQRRHLVKALAKRRGLDADALWFQFAGSDDGTGSSLLSRSLWHLNAMRRGLSVSKERGATSASSAAWLVTLAELKPAVLQSRSAAVDIVKFGLSFQHTTANVERALGKVALSGTRFCSRDFRIQFATVVQLQAGAEVPGPQAWHL